MPVAGSKVTPEVLRSELGDNDQTNVPELLPTVTGVIT
jgi:hypothetical protein